MAIYIISYVTNWSSFFLFCIFYLTLTLMKIFTALKRQLFILTFRQSFLYFLFMFSTAYTASHCRVMSLLWRRSSMWNICSNSFYHFVILPPFLYFLFAFNRSTYAASYEFEIDLNECEHYLKTNLDRLEINPSCIDLNFEWPIGSTQFKNRILRSVFQKL